ncbi:MAG: hypothetical protein JRE81_03510 [Deltaproteobacteria bacterium]|nr:hypothetical protein [Deltaproteobacteria bacterium]
MACSNQLLCALFACATLVALGSSGCSGSSTGCGAAGNGGSAGDAGNGGEAGVVGAGGDGGADTSSGAGGAGGVDPTAREQEVLFVGGFMSELYEALSLNLENEINDALRDAARALNVHIELPLDRSIDIAIGDAIANALPRISLPLEPGGFISFHTQAAACESMVGITCENISKRSDAFDSIESVDHNAAAILAYLEAARESRKQIIIVSHSKGGLDTLHALLLPEAEDLWGDTVIGWVALQAPFYGSPVADVAPSRINALLLSAVGGNGQSLDDLKRATREGRMAGYTNLAALTSAIPIISAYSTYEAGGSVTGFASAFASGIFDATIIRQIRQIVVDNYQDTPLDLPGVISRSTSSAVSLIRQRITNALDAALATIGLMDLTNVFMNNIEGGLPNDGLVPSYSTELRGAIHRELTLGDHASPVMDVDPLKNFWTVQQRNAITMGLITEVRSLAGVGGE